MADHYFINGGNTSDPLNYSLSSGGPNDTGVPTLTDNVIFDQAVNATVDTVLTCADINYTTNNSFTVNADVEVHGDVTNSGSGNWTDGGGFIRCRGDVTVTSVGNQAEFEFIGDDTNLTLGTNMRIRPTLNKNVGMKLIITQSAFLNSFFSDWIVEEGILDLGAFDLSGSGDFTMNGGEVTSTTGILDQERFFLTDCTLDPFKCISSTSSNSTLFTDTATVILMPSGGDFEFNGSNHWDIDQNFTEFPHLIFNKCVSCGQTGQWYAQDVTIEGVSKWGGGFIRGNLVRQGGSYNGSSGTQTFDGTGIQTVTGNVTFYILDFNKASGTLTFNDDFRLKECHNIAGGDLVDFKTTLCHILATGSHLNASNWEVVGVKFYSIELEIATTGGATMNSTVALGSFTLTQTSSLSGDIAIGGDFTVVDPTVTGTLLIILNGTVDQYIDINAGSVGLVDSYTTNKSAGSVIQASNVGNTSTDISVLKGIWCTNEFNLDAEDITILPTVSELQKTPGSTITSVNPIDGTVTNVSECGKKNSILAIL